jgi:transcriptional regulator with XRE-family HTH domain
MQATLGMRIREARQRYGMSQAELARRIGISTVAMNQIELGETDPRASRITAIAETLRVSTDSLLLGRKAEGINPVSNNGGASHDDVVRTPPQPKRQRTRKAAAVG